MPSIVPRRKWFFLLSEEYLEKNQSSHTLPGCYLVGIMKWGGDVKAAEVVRAIWLLHVLPH